MRSLPDIRDRDRWWWEIENRKMPKIFRHLTTWKRCLGSQTFVSCFFIFIPSLALPVVKSEDDTQQDTSKTKIRAKSKHNEIKKKNSFNRWRWHTGKATLLWNSVELLRSPPSTSIYLNHQRGVGAFLHFFLFFCSFLPFAGVSRTSFIKLAVNVESHKSSNLCIQQRNYWKDKKQKRRMCRKDLWDSLNVDKRDRCCIQKFESPKKCAERRKFWLGNRNGILKVKNNKCVR